MDDFSARNDRIVSLYEDDRLTILEIADKLKMTRQRVHQILKRKKAKMRRRGKRNAPLNKFICKYDKCKKEFESRSKSRVYCSRKRSHNAMRKYRTAAEKRKFDEERKKKAAKRASDYYHNVFKKKKDWRKIVRERNKENIKRRSLAKKLK